MIATALLIDSDWGQNQLTGIVISRLSKDLKAKISIRHISFSLLNKMNLEGFLAEDQHKDTLLAAGNLQVRITDWFIFKSKAELKYIGLQDAAIHLKRTDSAWNYQFLVDYFSSPSSSNNNGGLELNLKKVSLKNVRFFKEDKWIGRDMRFEVGSMNLDANEINFTTGKIDVNTIDLDRPLFSIYDYDGNRPERKDTAAANETATPQKDTSLQWNPGNLQVHIATLNLNDGLFKNDRQTDRPAYTYFDGEHIEFGKINAAFKNLELKKDTISASLHLSSKERSGFEVRSFNSDVKATPEGMYFTKLHILTNNSEIKDYFAMKYEDFSDMDDFIHKINMEANFDNSHIDSDDIAYFAPELKSWEKDIYVDGMAKGTVDAMIGRNINIHAGANTYLSGDISLTGLPDINQTFIDFKANDFGTNYNDVSRLFPDVKKIKEVEISKINRLHFTGIFTGFLHDFVTYGTIETNLGTLKSDLNMKLPKGKEPVYSGNIALKDFRLGEFVNNNNIGAISFDGTVKGSGFNLNKISGDLNGKISSIDFNGYTYRNIETRGTLSKKYFNGFVSMNDSNAQLSLNGLIDFKEKIPKFNFTAAVQKANLKALKLSDDSLDFAGIFNLDFSGNNIDNFLGTARITNASLLKNGSRLSFDSLVLTANNIDGQRTLTAMSNEFEGTLKGSFSIAELPDAVQLFLHRYYPAYISSTKYKSKKEKFSFDITTRGVEDYIKLLDKNLSGFNDSHVSGHVDLSENTLTLKAEVPQFSYKQYLFNNSSLTGSGNFDSLVVLGKSSNINVNDSLNLISAEARIVAHNDTSYVQIATGANHTLGKANINATVRTLSNGVNIHFDSSSFIINDKRWTIQKDGELDFRNNVIASGEMLLRESIQEIRLETKPSAEGNWNDLLATVKNVNIGDITPYLVKSPRIEGLLSGTVKVEDPYNKFHVTSEMLADQLRIDNDSIGKVAFNGITYDNHAGELKAKGRNFDPDHSLGFDVDLFLKDSSRAKDNRISLTTKTYPIKILDRFIGFLFSDLKGYATTNLDITGDFNNLNYVGKATLHDAGLRVKFTQCFYKIDDGDIELKKDAIDFSALKLHDSQGNSATIQRGIIQHHSFKDMFFDIEVKTDEKPMELLNTSFMDNKSFYGRAKGTGYFFLSGPESDLLMEIYANASDKDSSYITIPSTTSRETSFADFLVEKKYGHELSDSAAQSNASRITYDVELKANPMVNIRMVLDELTGDEIKARGGGTLTIHSGSSEGLSLRGRYDIEDGNYLFTFQSFFKKPLVVKRGGNNYIEWNGDPYKATIHVEAQYTADNVSFAPLVSSLQLDPNISRIRSNVYVITNLTGDLFKPNIGFRIEFPPGSEGATNAAVSFGLQQVEKDPNELNKQVTYLIVFNSFAPVEGKGSATTGISIGETATNTLSGIFFNVLNNQFNKILNKLLKSDKYHFNISNTIYNRNFIDPNNKTALNIGSNLNFSVGRSFFNDRFILTFGGGIDAPLGQNTIQQNVQLLPDVTAEWLINTSGSVRAIFFYRENTDYLNTTATGTFGRTRRAGSSLSYRKEFDILGGDEQKNHPVKKKPLKQDAKQEEPGSEPKEN